MSDHVIVPGENPAEHQKKTLKEYTIQLVGEFDYVDQVTCLTTTNIHDAVVHMLYSDEFEHYDNHITVEYFASGKEANINLWLPYGLCVVYNIGEVEEDETDDQENFEVSRSQETR